jgi:hypothetical protein
MSTWLFLYRHGVVEIQTSTKTCPFDVAAGKGTRNVCSLQHGEVMIARVFGTVELAEETFPYEKEEVVSLSDDDEVGVRRNGSRDACGTAVEMGSANTVSEMGNVVDLWAAATDGLWVEETDGGDFCSFGQLHREVALCSLASIPSLFQEEVEEAWPPSSAVLHHPSPS